VNEEAWVPFNVGSFSFENLKLFSSFGHRPKAFEYQHLCPLAISLPIKSKPELCFFFTSIVVKYIINYKPKSIFCTFCEERKSKEKGLKHNNQSKVPPK
jgi:hypothetical protein